MKRFLLYVCIPFTILFTVDTGLYSQESQKVLLYIRDGSGDLDYTLRNEVAVMKRMLEESGLEVMIATVSGQPLETDSVKVIPDVKMADVELSRYSGLIIPCMHAGATEPDPDAIRLVREAVEDEKPVAVQHAAILILAKAGLIQGRKYTFHEELDKKQFPEFEASAYSGTGVVKDGDIITSGVCPYVGMLYDMEDGTELLSQIFIAAVKEKAENS